MTSFCPLQVAEKEPTDEFSCFSIQMMQRQVIASLRSLAVSIIMCEEEADICLSRDARLYSHLIYGIISNDSDCAIMRGVRWIPVSSLTLQWRDARQGQSPVYVDVGMREHFASSRQRVYGKCDTPVASVSTSAFAASLSQTLVFTAARCQVWTNAAVMAALSLSDYSQLVNVAMLAGNDFTREHTNLWWHLLPRTSGKNKVDKWALFVTQTGQRDKRAEEFAGLKLILSQHKALRRGFRHSRAIYEGIDELLVTAQPASALPQPSGSTAEQPIDSAPPIGQSAIVPLPAQHAPSLSVPRPRARVLQVLANGTYGFLRVRAGPQALFYHQKNVGGGQLLSVGDEVEYEEGDNEQLAGKRQALRIVATQFNNPQTKGKVWQGYRPSSSVSPSCRSASTPLGPSDRRFRAVVTQLKAEAGYGFLFGRNSSDHVFFHQSNVLNSQLLSLGDEVEYEEGDNERLAGKKQALRIAVIQFSNPQTKGVSWEAKRPSTTPSPTSRAASSSVGPSGRPRAFVTRLVADAGYGFLGGRAGVEPVFFHQSNVLNSQLLSVGDEVEYEEGVSEKDASRRQAMHIQVVRFHDETARGMPWVPNSAARSPAAPHKAGSGRQRGVDAGVMSSGENGELQIAEPDRVPDNLQATRIQPVDNGEELKELHSSTDDVESMTAALDAMNMDKDDLASIRHLIALGQLPSDTLSCIVREFDQVAVYVEQLHPNEQILPFALVGRHEQSASFSSAGNSLSFSSFLLPPIERITRPLRAGFALLCGKRQQQLVTVVGHTYKQLDAPLVYDQILPHYIDASRLSARIPLFSVPEWPIDYRLQSFVRPFGSIMDGGVDLVSSQILQSTLPLSLRLPVLACRFMLHSLMRQGCSLHQLNPLIDSLIAMFLVLFALEPATPSSVDPSRASVALKSAVPHVLFVRDTARLSFPILLVCGLASMYQSMCSNLLNLSQLLRLPENVLERLPPHRLLHGPLLLSLLQDAIPLQITTVASSNNNASRTSSILQPACVSLDLLRFRVVRGDLSVSSTSSSHTLLQSVTAAFTAHYQLCRMLIYAPGDNAVSELTHAAPSQLRVNVDMAVNSHVAAKDEVDGKQPVISAVSPRPPNQQRRQQHQPRAQHTASNKYKTEPRRWLPVEKSPTSAARPVATTTSTASLAAAPILHTTIAATEPSNSSQQQRAGE